LNASCGCRRTCRRFRARCGSTRTNAGLRTRSQTRRSSASRWSRPRRNIRSWATHAENLGSRTVFLPSAGPAGRTASARALARRAGSLGRLRLLGPQASPGQGYLCTRQQRKGGVIRHCRKLKAKPRKCSSRLCAWLACRLRCARSFNVGRGVAASHGSSRRRWPGGLLWGCQSPLSRASHAAACRGRGGITKVRFSQK
jgi:hypothetical protein